MRRRALGTGPEGVAPAPRPSARPPRLHPGLSLGSTQSSPAVSCLFLSPPKSVRVFFLRKMNKTKRPVSVSQPLAVRPPQCPSGPATHSGARSPPSRPGTPRPRGPAPQPPPGRYPRASSPVSTQQPGWNPERRGRRPLLSTSRWRRVSPWGLSGPQDARPRPSGSPRLSGSLCRHPGLPTVPSGWSSRPRPAVPLAGRHSRGACPHQ